MPLYELTKEQASLLVEMMSNTMHDEREEIMEALKSPVDPMIQIGMEGGIIQGCNATHPVDVVVFEYDSDAGEEDDRSYIPTYDAHAYISWPTVYVNKEETQKVFAEAGAAKDEAEA